MIWLFLFAVAVSICESELGSVASDDVSSIFSNPGTYVSVYVLTQVYAVHASHIIL